MNTERLRVLVAVARTGSLAAAAESLGVGASAVSQQISTFEREVDGDLLIRSTKPATLTKLGRELVAHGEVILAELERAEVTAQGALTRVSGPYIIAALPSVAVTMLPETMQYLAQTAPDLRLYVRDLDTTQSLDALAAQQVDMAIVDSHPLMPVAFPSNTSVAMLGEEPFQVLAPKAFESARSGRLVDYASHPWVLPSAATAGGSAAKQLLSRADFEPDVRMETHDLYLLRTFVASGLGVTLLPKLALGDPPDGCVAIDVTDVGARRSLHAVTRSSTVGRVADTRVLDAFEHVSKRHLESN